MQVAPIGLKSLSLLKFRLPLMEDLQRQAGNYNLVVAVGVCNRTFFLLTELTKEFARGILASRGARSQANLCALLEIRTL